MFHASFEPELTNVKLYCANGIEEQNPDRHQYYKVVGVPTCIVMKTYIPARGLTSNQVAHLVPRNEKQRQIRLEINGQTFYAKVMPVSTPSDELIIRHVRDFWLKDLIGAIL